MRVSSAAVALSTTSALVECNKTKPLSPGRFGRDVVIDHVLIVLDTLAGATRPAFVTWRVCLDKSGLIPIAPERTDPITLGVGSTVAGTVAVRGPGRLHLPVGGGCYLFASVDAGTADGTAHLSAHYPEEGNP